MKSDQSVEDMEKLIPIVIDPDTGEDERYSIEKIDPTAKRSRRDMLLKYRAKLPPGDPAVAAIDRILAGNGTPADIATGRATYMLDESPDLQERRRQGLI